MAQVRFWPIADIADCNAHVRFPGKAGTRPIAVQMSANDPKRISDSPSSCQSKRWAVLRHTCSVNRELSRLPNMEIIFCSFNAARNT